MHVKTVEVNWKITKVLKRVKVARTDQNAESRRYYSYDHIAEREHRTMSGKVRVAVDLDEIILRLAGRAARNSSGKATAMHGLLKAQRISQQVLKSETESTPIAAGFSEVQPQQ